MFNLKWGKDVSPAIKTGYPKEVKNIHNEFFTTGERLLAEAKNIIAHLDIKDAAKIERLKKIGFSKSKQVADTEKAIAAKRQAEERAKIVEYYSVNYPLYKFITEDAVKGICEKYNLVMGDIRQYKGFVPEKNLTAIENFSVKEDDCISEVRLSGVFGDREYLRQMQQYQQFQFLHGSSGGVGGFTSALQNMQRPQYLEPTPVTETKYIHKGVFKICAPISDMDTSGHEVKGHELVVHVPDPVVLHPVKNGYLIVTAWGDEASDEMVVNETNN